MSKPNFILVICIYIMLVFQGCTPHGTIISALANDEEYGTIFEVAEGSAEYEKRVPCDPTILIKIEPEEVAKYHLIGTCKTTAPSGGWRGTENRALVQIKKCACYHGGDLAIIVGAEELGAVKGRLIDVVLNPNPGRKIFGDKIEAVIGRKIEVSDQ